MHKKGKKIKKNVVWKWKCKIAVLDGQTWIVWIHAVHFGDFHIVFHNKQWATRRYYRPEQNSTFLRLLSAVMSSLSGGGRTAQRCKTSSYPSDGQSVNAVNNRLQMQSNWSRTLTRVLEDWQRFVLFLDAMGSLLKSSIFILLAFFQAVSNTFSTCNVLLRI